MQRTLGRLSGTVPAQGTVPTARLTGRVQPAVDAPCLDSISRISVRAGNHVVYSVIRGVEGHPDFQG